MSTIENIGSIADITAIYYHELVKDGIKEEVAMIFTAKFIECFMKGLSDGKPDGKPEKEER